MRMRIDLSGKEQISSLLPSACFCPCPPTLHPYAKWEGEVVGHWAGQVWSYTAWTITGLQGRLQRVKAEGQVTLPVLLTVLAY